MLADTHDHKHHVLPLSLYIGIGGALFVLTGVTVGVSYIDLGGTGNLIVAMAVATFKATLVALFFMHLLYDSKLYALAFSIGLFMLTAFVVLTMFDTMRRDGIYEEKATPIENETAGFYEKLKAEPPAEHHDSGHY